MTLLSEYDNFENDTILLIPDECNKWNVKGKENLRNYFTFSPKTDEESFLLKCQCMTDTSLSSKTETVCCGCCKRKKTLQPTFLVQLGKVPVLVTCPSCRSPTETRVVYQNTSTACCFSIFLGPLALCWSPLCIKRHKIARHYCSVCGIYIGST